ncbi:protein-arginine deiminase type-4-like [Tachyglossus aculeatus]|uniref:protein-arginine deiminase type-4-like n=1 Tax=Tachyglossus aculeatus TaxID=9261 RepID=UPI0018F537A8|nr:protein-arginine deiminase type-4-like [Tachyglossus aculeatus]
MSQPGFVRVSVECPTYAVCAVGTETLVDVWGCAPRGSTAFNITSTRGVVIDTANSFPVKKTPTGLSKWSLNPTVEVVVILSAPSLTINKEEVWISYYGPRAGPVLGKAVLYLTGVDISLDADTTRSGKVNQSPKEVDKRNWTWGPRGHGAVLLVNCDRDGPQAVGLDKDDDKVLGSRDLKDMSLMVLRAQGPEEFFAQHKLVLHIPMSKMKKVRVFQSKNEGFQAQFEMVLGPHKASHVLEPVNGQQDRTFYIEGLAFPDADFSGLVPFSVTLLGRVHQDIPEAPIFEDTVVFRVAPWIMTPNTLAPQEVYVCSIKENQRFVDSVTALAKKAKCKLTICPEEVNDLDVWIQDEMEVGYIQAPHKTLPVVFDSPRDGGLKDFPFKYVLGPDFGYVTRNSGSEWVDGLTSFGNLEVSPPVSVRGKEYPLGRVLVGSNIFPRTGGREIVKPVWDFLYAQRVQAPIKLFSDWLLVGHVDEFLSFVRARKGKGFRLLLASPVACFQLFREKQLEGHGAAMMFEQIEGKEKKTIDDILSDQTLSAHNRYVQSCIDWNREILKRDLGLVEQDIIDLPQLFQLTENNSSKKCKAEAFFPDMVNMVVLGKYLGIPKPFGPVINGRCCLEEKVRSLLEPLGLNCTFIDDFSTYHKRKGDVHCGTNVRRKPFSFKWWNMVP